MALTDIVAEIGASANASFADRGDVGSLVDQLGDPNASRLFITLPTAAQVETGVMFGNQDSLTGTFVGGGGGGDTVTGSQFNRGFN
jgi:hypothetical protein